MLKAVYFKEKQDNQYKKDGKKPLRSHLPCMDLYLDKLETKYAGKEPGCLSGYLGRFDNLGIITLLDPKKIHRWDFLILPNLVWEIKGCQEIKFLWPWEFAGI